MSDHVREHIAARLHDELSPDESLRFDEHVAGCPECRNAFEAARALDSELSGAIGYRAPDGLWDRISAELQQPAPRVRRRWRPLAAAGIVVAASAAILLVSVMKPGPAQVSLDGYLQRIESAPAGRTAEYLGSLGRGFKRVDTDDALRAAGIPDDAKRRLPEPDASLRVGATRDVNGAAVTQLVVADAGEVYTVFMAPHSARLDFGERKTQRVRMGEWECTQVDSEDLAVYWSFSGDRQSVLVARADAALDFAGILQFFVYGEWTDWKSE